MKTKTGWYWHRSKPDSVTYWNGSKWGKTVPRASLGGEPIFHSESGKELTNHPLIKGISVGEIPPRNRAFSRRGVGAADGNTSWPRAVMGFVVITVVSVWLFNSCSRPHEPSSTEAGLVCEQFVKDRLKSPSTASFSGTAAYGIGGGYSATTTVDSQNSFGATLRSTWTCEVAWSEGNEKWQLKAIAQK